MALPKQRGDREYWRFFQDNVAYTNDAGTAVAIGTFVGGQYNASAPTYADGDPVVFQFTSSGLLKTDATVSIEGDINIGSVELKDATSDTRAVIKSDGTNNALVVTMNTLPALVAGTATIGDVTVSSITGALPAGTATIGSVKITDGSETLSVCTDGAAIKTKGILLMGTDGTNAQTVSMNSDGDVNIADGGNVITVDGSGSAGTAATGVVTVQGIAGMTAIATTETVPTTLTGGSKTVATSGTAEALGTTLATKSIYIRAKAANTSFVCVGDSNVDKATSQQIVLYANDSVTLEIADRATVYIDVNVNSEGVDYLAVS